MGKITVIAGALAFSTDGKVIDYKSEPVELTVGSFQRNQERVNNLEETKLQGENDLIV